MVVSRAVRLLRRRRPSPPAVEDRSWAQGGPSRSFADVAKTAEYVLAGHATVEGWSGGVSMWVAAALAARQLDGGVRGSSVEIGVHHGQFLVLLGLASAEGERAVGYDLFDSQTENVDSSGSGNRTIVEGHLREWGLDGSRVGLVAANSHDLTAQDVLRDAGAPVRMMSIDGGHTTETTLNDLRLADGCLHPDGLVLLDDVFHPGFPGVISGLRRFEEERPGRLVPVGLVGNKALLCRPEVRHDVFTTLEDAGPGFFTRIEYFFGHLVRILLPDASTSNEWRAGWWPEG